MEFKEHETLSQLFDLLPRRAQKGLMTTSVEWTCMDADVHFIVLGANISLVYVYDRSEQTIIRLRPEDKSCSISCIKLQSSLDYQLAAGTNKGHVELYLLPSKAPGRGKEVRKMFLKGLHKTTVTCAAWSTNGMKLFTGDDLGTVMYTSVDLYEHTHQSMMVVKEDDTIVQLNYSYKTLLVSTASRALLCYTNEDNKCQQIGQQARKVKGNFGAMFIPTMCKPSDAMIYATRPGLRVWKAGMNGAVSETILFKDWLLKDFLEIKLLEDTLVDSLEVPAEVQFGKLAVVSGSLVVIWSYSCLFILNPTVEGKLAVIGRCHGLLGSIIDVTALDDEILVLRKSSKKPVIRLGLNPEKELAKEAYHFSEKEQSYLQSLKFSGSPSTSFVSGGISSSKQTALKEGLSTFKNVFKKAADELTDGAIKAKEDIERNARSLKLKLDILGEDSSSVVSSQGSDDRDGDFESRGERRDVTTPETPVPSVSSEKVFLKDYTENTDKNPAIVIEKEETADVPQMTPRSASPVPAMSQTSLNLQELKELSQEKFDDIVFQPKPKKKKKKKKQELDNQTKEAAKEELAEQAESEPPDITMETTSMEKTNQGAFEDDLNQPTGDTSDSKQEIMAKETILNPQDEVESEEPFETLEADFNHQDDLVAQSDGAFIAEMREEPLNDQPGTEIVGASAAVSDVIPESQSASSQENQHRFGHPKLNISDPQPLRSYEPEPDLPESGLSVSRDRPESVYQDIYGTSRRDWNGRNPLGDLLEVEDTDSETEGQELDIGDMDDLVLTENIQQKLSSSWLQCTTPGYITKLVASEKHIWCVDSKERIYFSLTSKLACSWNKLKGIHARQIAVSPSGNIVWIVKGRHNGAYASNAILPKSKIGTRWHYICSDVSSICLDDNTAWIISENGEVSVHSGITRERPYTHAKKVESNFDIREIVANRGVVWALTSEHKVVYRTEVSVRRWHGKKWKVMEDSSDLKAVSIALDSKHMGWAIDKEGRVWFRTGVILGQPEGDDKRWWQVTMSEYLMEDSNVLKMVVNMAGSATRMDKVVSWLTSHQAIQVTANSTGVWVCAQFQRKTTLQVSRGNLLGSSWGLTNPLGLPSATCWISISAAAVYGPSGMIWAAQKSGEVFCFSPMTMKPTLINPPEREKLIQVSASADVLWALSANGNIYLRVGISPKCPQGKEWKKLDMAQLASSKVVNLSCGQENVWACDTSGNCYMRVGIDLPQHDALPFAWLPVDSKPQTFFTQVCVGPTDSMVWAIDNKKAVYSRMGVTKDFPVGLEWVLVEGTQAQELCISSDTVWALCPNGDIACRFGTSQRNAEGNYWKKIPGNFANISVTQTNDLWSLSKEGQIFKRSVKIFKRQHFDSPSSPQPGHDLEEDWELL